MVCTDCSWYWQGDEDDFPCCQCDEGMLSCELDALNEDDEDDEDYEDYSELNFDALVDYHNIGNYTP